MSERPVECSHCKKPIQVIYKEIVEETVTCTHMCEDCPILQQKMTGELKEGKRKKSDIDTGLCCGSCGTTLESIQTGNPLGCSECYNVFGDILMQELLSMGMLPARLQKNLGRKKSQPLHIGKTPSTPVEIPASSRLTALNEALNEALKKENYEQAAWLRDQIKDLMDNPNERKKTTS
jgi:protein arginine kinase activator